MRHPTMEFLLNLDIDYAQTKSWNGRCLSRNEWNRSFQYEMPRVIDEGISNENKTKDIDIPAWS